MMYYIGVSPTPHTCYGYMLEAGGGANPIHSLLYHLREALKTQPLLAEDYVRLKDSIRTLRRSHRYSTYGLNSITVPKVRVVPVSCVSASYVSSLGSYKPL